MAANKLHMEMKPQCLFTIFDSDPEIRKLLSSVSIKLDNSRHPVPEYINTREKRNHRIEMIYATMHLEGIGISKENITKIVQRKNVRGLQERIRDIRNLNKVYNQLKSFDPMSGASLVSANAMIMDGRPEVAGRIRDNEVAIFREKRILGFGPPAGEMMRMMKGLFEYLKSDEEDLIIKSCMAHYTILHSMPFSDRNGMMGLIWQRLLLVQRYPVFEYLPIELRILQSSREYFRVLSISEKTGDPAGFILFMLEIIDNILDDCIDIPERIVTSSDRLHYFYSLGIDRFRRKDYMNVFKNISTATASRDLVKGLEAGLFEKAGNRNLTIYKCRKV